MTTITPANFSFKDDGGDLGQVKSLTTTDITLLNTALQDIEDLKLAIQNPSPTGMVALWDDTNIPEGWLLCNGAAVSRSTYAALFAKLGTRHGAGNGSTTFNLPDMRDRYPIGVGTNALGTAIAEQLPNVIGMMTLQYGAVPGLTHTSGAITNIFSDVATLGLLWGDSRNGVQVNFNANWSNSVYTDSGKVYPLSLALNFIIKAQLAFDYKVQGKAQRIYLA